MFCPNCDGNGKFIMMESMGYGDEVCPVCGHKEYTETEEEFNARIWGTDDKAKDEEKE